MVHVGENSTNVYVNSWDMNTWAIFLAINSFSGKIGRNNHFKCKLCVLSFAIHIGCLFNLAKNDFLTVKFGPLIWLIFVWNLGCSICSNQSPNFSPQHKQAKRYPKKPQTKIQILVKSHLQFPGGLVDGLRSGRSAGEFEFAYCPTMLFKSKFFRKYLQF